MLATALAVLSSLVVPQREPVTITPAGESAQVPTVPPTFPSRVELITVDAVVLDKQGQPVPGLTRDDFAVKEDGQPRAIVSFEAFDAGVSGPQPESVAPAVVASNEVKASDVGRAFAIVVDDLGIAPERTGFAQEAVRLFLQHSARSGDSIALGSTSGDAWWSARLPEGREDLLAVLARLHGRRIEEPPTLSATGDSEEAQRDPSGSARGAALAGFVARIERHRLLSTLAVVRRAIEAVASVRGRKCVLLLSDGFVDPEHDARAVVALSREANAAVYFVDARGLEAFRGGRGSAASSGREHYVSSISSAGAVDLAYDTGGFAVRNTNDLAAGADRVATESRVFYLLGFHPQENKPPDDWRDLRVEVKRPGLTVRARKGYTLRSEMDAAATPAKTDKESKGGRKEPELNPVLARAIDSPHIASRIPLRAIAYVLEPRPNDTVHVLVSAEFDADAIRPVASGPARLEVTAVAVLRDTGRVFGHATVFAVTRPKSDEPRWRSFTRELELPPGVAQIRVVVRDPASGALGSVMQRIEVPSAGEFRISTPILTDRMAPATSRDPLPQPALSAHRAFPSGGGLYCQYEVFGAQRSGGAAPQVEASFTLRRASGEVLREAPLTPIAIALSGRLVRTVGTSLGQLEGGDYELVLDVRDKVSGGRVVRHEPFALGSREER